MNELEKLFDEFVGSKYNRNYLKKESGYYSFEPYIDYRDSDALEERANDIIKKYDFKSKDELVSVFENEILDCYTEYEWEIKSQVENDFSSFLEDKGIEYDNDEMSNLIQDNVFFDDKDVLDIMMGVEVKVDIIPLGENDTQYLEDNAVYIDCDDDDIAGTLSGTAFETLFKKLGTSVDEVASNYENGDRDEICDEINECSGYCYNPTFFVRMSLDDFFKVKGANAGVTISRGADCGFVDFCNGSCSHMGVHPNENISFAPNEYMAFIDGNYGYGVESICGGWYTDDLCKAFAD